MADKSVVDVYPLCPHPPVRPLRATLRVGYVAPLHYRNALPWPKSSRSTGYNFSQPALGSGFFIFFLNNQSQITNNFFSSAFLCDLGGFAALR